jgi:hypothetical protein
MNESRVVGLAACLAFAAFACGAQPKQANSDDSFNLPAPSAGPEAAAPPPAAAPSPASAGDARMTPALKEQLNVALGRGARGSAECVKGKPDAPHGEGQVKITYDGQKGKATDVWVGPPYAGTPIESCIKQAFIAEYIIPFEGEPMVVPYTLNLAAPAPVATTKKK